MSSYTDSAATAPESQAAPNDEAGLRMAVLARAIESEIIPRLMLAHRTANECVEMPAHVHQQVSTQDVEHFTRLILARSEQISQAWLEALRLRGVSVESIYLDLLAPVARHLGKLWEDDLCDFTEVTIGLGRLQQLLRELSPAFGQAQDRPPNGHRVLLLPSPGEQHTFGLVMVAEFFRRRGWDVAGGAMGSGVDPVEAVRGAWFDVVGFALGAQTHLPALNDTIQQVRRAAQNPRVGIMVGGPALAVDPSSAARVLADVVATDGRQAPDLALQLVTSRAQRA